MKKIRISFIFIVIIIISNLSFASFEKTPMPGNDNNSDLIAYASSTEVNVNSEFYLVINLSKIDYSAFNVKIINSSQMTANNIPNGISDVSQDSSITSFNVNKNDISLDKLAITYTSPNTTGSVDFDVTITNTENDVSTLRLEVTKLENEITELNKQLDELKNKSDSNDSADSLNETDETSTDSNEQIKQIENSISEKEKQKSQLEEKIANYKQKSLTSKVTITVGENVSKEMNSQDSEMDMDKKMMDQDDKMDGMLSNMKKMMDQVEELEGNLKTANNTINDLTESVTYQGSQNNYLESLSITGVEFNSTFKKTTQTYFANVDSTVNSVEINAVPESSDAIVTTYGNTELVSGKNKILITVTADDGSTRTYKIYVTK